MFEIKAEDYKAKHKLRITAWFLFRYRSDKLSLKGKEKVIDTYSGWEQGEAR